MRYRDTVIKAWSGIYELDLPEPFFLLAYDSGLGSKNPQGFGMVEVITDYRGR
jgi:CRISPR-associated endoribonuclease Cas6